ncbi:MAG: NUDIX domain-containing protein [Sedimentisphaerales bacterium]|nr:NUDIX domain-containing protein [Sedimentisphaerales bacterium]
MTERLTLFEDRPYLQFCPHCGKSTLNRPIVQRLMCRSCGFKLYFNAASAVIALITDGLGRLLVTTRAREPAKGSLGLPGGFVDLGETAEQALSREIMEELKAELVSARYFCTEPNIYPYKGVTYVTVDMAFLCEVSAPERVEPADDVQAIQWLYPNQIRPEDFGLVSMRNIMRRFLAQGQVS